MVHWCGHRNQHVVNFEIPPFSCIRSIVHLLHLMLIVGCFYVLTYPDCIYALRDKLGNRESEIVHLQAQLDKLCLMNFGSRSEKVSHRIAQMEADLNRLLQESDALTGSGLMIRRCSPAASDPHL